MRSLSDLIGSAWDVTRTLNLKRNREIVQFDDREQEVIIAALDRYAFIEWARAMGRNR